MTKKYIGVWAIYDEDFLEGLEIAFKRYVDAGIKHIMYGGIAHTFDVHKKFFKNTCIDPYIEIEYERTRGDIFGTKKNLINSDYRKIQTLAKKNRLSIGLNITPGVSEPIIEMYPNVAVKDINGRKSKHWMCPSNKDVRAYFLGRIKDILMNYEEINEVELDVIGLDFYDPQVVPDWIIPELYPLRQFAINNCFCDSCIERARKSGLDIDKVVNEILSINQQAKSLTYNNFRNLHDSYRCVFDAIRFFVDRPNLINWIKFRSEIIESFVSDIKNLVKGINPNILISNDLVSPSFSWQLGQIYSQQTDITDITKLMIYHKRIGSFESKPLRKLQNFIPQIREEELLDQYYLLKGFKGPNTLKRFEEEGLNVESIYYETRKAKLEVGKKHRLIVGICGDPPTTGEDIFNAIRMAKNGGANGYMLHLWYGNSPKENIDKFGDSLRYFKQI